MRYRLRTFLVVAAITPPLLAAIIAFVLHIADAPRERKARATRQLLNRLRGETDMWMIISHAPPQSLGALLNDLNRDAAQFGHFDRIISYPTIENGMDAWGRKLILEVGEGGVVTLRSVGQNGVDEAGRGDDIEVRVDRRTSNEDAGSCCH